MSRDRCPIIGLLVASVVAVFPSAGTIAGAEPKPLWLAVGTAELVRPLEALAAHRRHEGFQTVISTGSIRDALARAPRRPEFLLLVGDDEPGKEAASWYLPAKRRELYRWREVQRKQFSSDAAWADLDGDLVPDIAVGRIPARTAKQAERVVEKILAFERHQPGPGDLQLLVWGGSAEYGPMIDVMASELLLSAIQANAPGWIRPWIISGDLHHPFCGWPPDQPALFSRQIRRGGICGVLIGYADAERFYSMSFRGQRIGYSAPAAEAEPAQGPPAPPLVFFSCESGNFARPTPCLAEALLSMPGGPVAAVGATTESHPLTNCFSSMSLLRALGGPQKRIGTLWLSSQRRAIKSRNALVERVLRDVEGKLEDEINLAKLRRDQILMYAVLGDPATRLRLPGPLRASIRRTAAGWHWKAERPEGATKLHVGCRAAGAALPRRQGKPAGQKEARACFEAANAAPAFRTLPSPPDEGPWEGTVDRPGLIRLVATGAGRFHAAVFELK